MADDLTQPAPQHFHRSRNQRSADPFRGHQACGNLVSPPAVLLGSGRKGQGGWGTEYLLTADWRIATPGAVFGLPETGLGILPGAGGTAELWSHIGVAQTLRLGMTGERIGPDEARDIGLVQELAADHASGMQRAHALAARVAKASPTAIASYKRAVLEAVGSDPTRRDTLEAQAYERCVRSGEAAIGRENFSAIREGGRPPWGMKSWE